LGEKWCLEKIFMPQGENVNGFFLKSFMQFCLMVFSLGTLLSLAEGNIVFPIRFGTWNLLGLGTLGARKWDGERWA